MIETDPNLLVESPMDRYECCVHCRHGSTRHDGHAGPCGFEGCVGMTRLGECP